MGIVYFLKISGGDYKIKLYIYEALILKKLAIIFDT